MEPQSLLAPVSMQFKHLKNPRKMVLVSPFHHSKTWDVLNISTLLSTGDGNVQGHGLDTVLLPLVNLTALSWHVLS